MNISYQWLKEYVDFDMTAEEIGTTTHPYSGTTTYSGSFTGTRVE